MRAELALPTPARLPPAVQAVLLPVALFLALALAMEGAKHAGWLPITVPAPSQIWQAFEAQKETLLYHAVPTIEAAAAGYGLAILLALTLAALTSLAPRSERPVFRFGLVLDSIPLIALSPLLMVWLGNGMAAHILIAMIACKFPLLVGAVQGFKAADRNGAELFHVLSASPWQRFRLLTLPTALPYLFAALKIAAPLAVLGALIGEWVSAERGLGIMMVYALFSFDAPQVWLTILAVCALAMAGYGLVAGLEWLVVTWDTGGTLDHGAP